jgi:molybdenum cofactor cytidylyltransferase
VSYLPSEILIAVLGAGSARRFGADKLTQPCGDRQLGSWALQAAQATGARVVWIAGSASPDWVTCEVATNQRASEGIGTSVALAAQLAQARDAKSLLVTLADMPLVTVAMLRDLITGEAPAAFRQPDGRPGVPALIPSTMFGQLQALTGDQGAGNVLAGQSDLTLLDAPPHALLDVDTPEALADAERWLSQRGPCQ